MPTVLRYLPALLTLLVPLACLFWLGSGELSRLEHRADSILQNEAYVFLRTADRKVQQILKDNASRCLERPLDLDNRSPVEAAGELSLDDWALDLLLLDTQGQLLYPRLPRFRQPSAPLRDLPQTGDATGERMFLMASLMESLGDLRGAREKLQELVKHCGRKRLRRSRQRYLMMRTLFDLASLQARAGDTDAAQVNYLRAGDLAEQLLSRKDANAFAEDAAAIFLLHEAGRPQLTNEPAAMLEILRDISIGIHDACADDFLDAVFHRLAAAIPTDAPEYAAIAGARQDNEIRKAGRRFAQQYRAHAAASVRKLLSQTQTAPEAGPVFHVLTTPEGSSILAMRRADMAEQLEHGAGWVGVRLDFAALLSEEVMAAIRSPEGGYFSLAILDPDGIPIFLPDPSSAVDFPVQVAPVKSLANLQLQAIPVANPGVGVRTTEENRLYLVLALIAVAAGGAVFLMRSVNRESELARLKVQLVSRVSHELKTPLAVIKMYGDTLLLGRARGQEQVGRFAGIISREADRLSGMIERILDFSRKEAGTLTYQSEPINLSELIAELTEEYRPHVESRGARLQTDVGEDLHVIVDPQAMTNAVVNLVENAVKFTPENAPDRTVQVHLSQQNGSGVLEIIDRGVGIPTREQSDVFSPFYRATTAGEVRGAGLGLTLVRHFAQSHGGVIKALARPDGGTIMRMTLPLASKIHQDLTPQPHPSEESNTDDSHD
ncbi:MAG: HAMP domain-containing sensor histidine kinase [Planctomycetota bacterium]